MLGHHSLSFLLSACDSDIEHIIRQLKAERNSNLLEECTIETIGDPIALRDHNLPTTSTSSSCLKL